MQGQYKSTGASRARRALPYVLSFVMGAAVAVLVFSFASNPSVPTEEINGTLIPGSSFRGWETIGTSTFAFEGGQATARTMTARTSSGRSLVTAEIELDSMGQVELSVEYDDGPLKLVSFSQDETSGEAVMTSGGVRLIHSGKGTYRIMLQRRGRVSPDIHISVTGTNVTESLPTATGDQG